MTAGILIADALDEWASTVMCTDFSGFVASGRLDGVGHTVRVTVGTGGALVSQGGGVE